MLRRWRACSVRTMTEKELLRRMLRNAVDARDLMSKVSVDAEETPIPGWLAVEITRILLSLSHLEAQLGLEVESAS